MRIKRLPGIQHGFKIIQPARGMEVMNGKVFSVMPADEELSIVCEPSIKLNSEQAETGLAGTERVQPSGFVRHGLCISEVEAVESGLHGSQ